jgi:hypothetical protein
MLRISKLKGDKMNKQGAEMALSTVITIIILLLIVVVVVVLIAKSTGKWNTGTSCISLGGRCSDEQSCTYGEVPNSDGSCTSGSCCKLISENS